MSDTSPPVESPEAVSDEVVSRENTEAYTLNVWTLSGHTTPDSQCYTYGRTEGLYKLSPNDHPEIVEALDEALAALEEKYGAVDEYEFSRIDGDAYEVLVTVEDAEDVSAYDAEFDHNRAVVHVVPDNDPEVVARVDDALEMLRDAVSE